LPTGETIVGQFGDRELQLEGTMTFDNEDGQSEPVTIDISGPAVRITRADGSTSTGWIDPYDNELVADGSVYAGAIGFLPIPGCFDFDYNEHAFDDDSEEGMLKEFEDAKEQLTQLTFGQAFLGGARGSDIYDNLQDAKDRYENALDRVLEHHLFGPKPRLGKVSGCEKKKSASTMGFDSNLRRTSIQPAADAPEWVAPLPGPYWNLEELGLEPLRFGPAVHDPFPFPIVTDWIPDTWNLPAAEDGWAIRAWSSPTIREAGIAPAVFTPYAAATLIAPEGEGRGATPVAVVAPHQAVIRSARTRASWGVRR
jgi:hypothetical protein